MKSNFECQECGADISIPEDAVKGEIITCPDCGAEYEIALKTENGVELKPAETVGEDWGQ